MADTIFIAMPTYDGEKFIREAILSIKNQTLQNFELHIFDNGPEGKNFLTINEIFNNSEKCFYHKNNSDFGAARNFQLGLEFFVNNTDHEYFMWAQSDDIWERTYLEKIYQHKGFNDIVVSGMNTIDSFGQEIRNYRKYSRFDGSHKFVNILKFLFEPESFGKCNIFMSVYKRWLIKDISDYCKFEKIYFDHEIAFAGIQKGQVIYLPEILYHKRYNQQSDIKGIPKELMYKNPSLSAFPVQDHIKLHRMYYRHCEKRWKKLLVVSALLIRMPLSIFASIKILIAKIINIRGVDNQLDIREARRNE